MWGEKCVHKAEKKKNIKLLAPDLNFHISVYLNHSVKYFVTYVEMG